MRLRAWKFPDSLVPLALFIASGGNPMGGDDPALEVLDARPLHGITVGFHALGEQLFLLGL